MTGVVEHIGLLAGAHTRHHVGHHGPQACPGHDLAGAYTREALIDPVHQGLDAVGADVAVVTVELGCACHTEAVCAQAAGHQLGLVVEQADRGRAGLAGGVEQVDSDGVALDRVDVDAVAQLRGQAAAAHAGTHYHGVEHMLLDFAITLGAHACFLTVALQAQDLAAIEEVHAQALAGRSQALGVLVDVTGRIALGVVAAEVVAGQRGLDGFHLGRRHGSARQAACGQELGDLARMLEALAVAVDMQDTLLLEVKVYAFGLGPGKQVRTRGNGQARCLNGVALVLGDAGDELCKPGQLVPARLGVEQQRRVLAQHPFEALDQGGRVCPGLGVRGRELSAVGKGGLHGGVTVPLEQGDLEAATGQGVGAGHAGDAATNDCDGFHEVRSKKGSSQRHCAANAPSVWNLRDSPGANRACSCGGLRPVACAALQSVNMSAGPGA